MRVFVSSTYQDNQHRRAIVQSAIVLAEMVPIGMESFPASAAPTVEDCLQRVRSCDVFVAIVAERYGWIPDGYEISICELEYDVARESELPRLIFEIDAADCDAGVSDQPKKLDAFRAKLRADQRPAQCRETDLGMVVVQSLMSLRSEAMARGEPAHSIDQEVVADLVRLRRDACEELDRSASILTNLPLDLSPNEAKRRHEAHLRLREIGVKLRNVGDVPNRPGHHLNELGLPDTASLRKAGSVFIRLSNNTTLCHQPTPEDQRSEEAANRASREEARRLLGCVGS